MLLSSKFLDFVRRAAVVARLWACITICVAGHCHCASPMRGQFPHCATPKDLYNSHVGNIIYPRIVRVRLSRIDSDPIHTTTIFFPVEVWQQIQLMHDLCP